MANLKTEVTKQGTPNYSNNEHLLPTDAHTYACISLCKKCSFFGKFVVLCFLVTFVRFEIRSFALSPTNSLNSARSICIRSIKPGSHPISKGILKVVKRTNMGTLNLVGLFKDSFLVVSKGAFSNSRSAISPSKL